jgi:hypothetical protein
VRSPERSLVVDTGLNHAVCLDALQTGLDRIGIDPARCDYFFTHLLVDHFGLITRLANDDTRVYVNRPEAEIIESLAKVRPYDVDLVLPGHRRLFSRFKARIDELIAHHRSRLDEVLNILADGPRNGFEVAARMRWDIEALDWEAFPVAQQWFATGEALAHLRYLEEEKKIRRQVTDGVVQFERG